MTDPKILAFTVTRASTRARSQSLLRTINDARSTAGLQFDWVVYCVQDTLGSGIAKTAESTGLVQSVVEWPHNKGQHVAFNDALSLAKSRGYDSLLRIDDDCTWMTRSWLLKLHAISKVFKDGAILTPAVRGLKNPPPRTSQVEVDGYPVEFLLEAIGGICRYHPVRLLVEREYVSDVRLPMGSGDAVGMGRWCIANQIAMVWCKSVRVRHATKAQEEDDEEHFSHHYTLQIVPYIEPWSGYESGVTGGL